MQRPNIAGFMAGVLFLLAGIAQAAETPVFDIPGMQNRIDEQALRDSRIRAEIMLTLGEEPIFRARGVSAEVKSGVVHLGGTVASEEEKVLAGRLAQTADGAVKVFNNISIASPSRM